MRQHLFNKTVLLISIFILLFAITFPAYAQSGSALVLNDVLGTPQDGAFAYDMSVYFSLVDSADDPIRTLNIADVSIIEDGKKVDPTGLEIASEDPINVVVVMDTSGSMSGSKMDSAVSAASRFIAGLGSEDRAALVSFNSQVKKEIDFTDNLPAVQEKIKLLDAVNGSGTCFYDALYEAVQISAGSPGGRRAIVVLTDGVDELPDGKKCSTYTDQDVIDIATLGTTRVPIYMIGLGNKVDSAGLDRIAGRTGGRYQFASNENKLEALFQRLGDQLRSQYRLSYISIAAPGPHVLALTVDTNSIHEQDSRDFNLPQFPYRIEFISPQENENVTGKKMISVNVLGQGEEKIAKIEFFVNGESIEADTTAPYEFEWTPVAGLNEATIEAAAFGEAGGELARKAVSVNVLTGTAEATALPGVEPTVTTKTSLWPLNDGNKLIWVGLIVFIMAVVVTVVLVIGWRRKQQEKARDLEWQQKVIGGPEDNISALTNEYTMDGFAPSDDALGMLVVLQSDDPAMNGQRIEINKPVTHLGRKSDNDIIFPKDNPVSRHHAVIEERGGNLFLSEVIDIADGSPKRPSFGTYVNGQKVDEAVKLTDRAEIQLGKRVRLRFEAVRTINDDSGTIDQMSSSGDDKTMDA